MLNSNENEERGGDWMFEEVVSSRQAVVNQKKYSL